MKSNWKELKNEIEIEVQKVWVEKPIEIKRMQHGIIPTKAGSYGQYFSTLVFSLIYTLTLGEHTLFDLLKIADEPDISLNALVKFTSISLFKGFQSTEFLGYVGFEKTHIFAQKIEKVLDTLDTKEEYKELLGAYFSYINILHCWIHIIFPWNLGLFFLQKDEHQVKEIIKLLQY